jgi:hypothetical protein
MTTSEAILSDFLATASTSVSSQETVSVRNFITDYRAGRYNFALPFQRKPQWKHAEKSAWIKALLRGVLVDPLSISKRGREKRGINGGNRARATVDYSLNRFPMDIEANGHTHHFWFDEIPAESQEGRQARFHHTLTEGARERFLDTMLSFNVRHNLTDQEEVDWYENMNRNQKAHTKGQLLVSQLCRDPTNPFVIAALDFAPELKHRIQMPRSARDEYAPSRILATRFDVDLNPMDERDEREDVAMAVADYANLLANGKPYNAGFVGTCDMGVYARNIATLHQIFDGLEFSEAMRSEFQEPSSVKKQFLPRIWSPAYLLGPICWSIGTQQENVVHVWRSFLQRCVPNTIAATYLTETNDLNLGDEAVRKYKTAWENVVRTHI